MYLFSFIYDEANLNQTNALRAFIEADVQSKLWNGESDTYHYYDGIMRMFGRLSAVIMPKLHQYGPGDTRQQLSGRGLTYQARVGTDNPRQRIIHGPVLNVGHLPNRERVSEMSGFIHDESLVSALLEGTVLHDLFMPCHREHVVEEWRNRIWRSVNLMWRYIPKVGGVQNSRGELELIFALMPVTKMWQLTGFESECRSLAGTEHRDGIDQA